MPSPFASPLKRSFFSTPGVIIRGCPVGEADLLVTLISAQYGKLVTLAKNARKSRRRFPGGLEVFDHGTLEISQIKTEVLYLQSFKLLSIFRQLRVSMPKLTLASLLCEAHDFLIPEHLFVDDETPLITPFFENDSFALYSSLFNYLNQIEQASTPTAPFKACFDGLAELLHFSGFLEDTHSITPSLNGMDQLIALLEHTAERPLVTKQSYNIVISNFRDELKKSL